MNCFRKAKYENLCVIRCMRLVGYFLKVQIKFLSWKL